MAYKLNDIYTPYDNSWCIDIESKQKALLVQPDFTDNYRPTKGEYKAVFRIVSEPYYVNVDLPVWKKQKAERFINVKSSKTGKVYRVIFSKYFEFKK